MTVLCDPPLSFIKLACINVRGSAFICDSLYTLDMLCLVTWHSCAARIKGTTPLIPEWCLGVLASCVLTSLCPHNQVLPPDGEHSALDTQEEGHLVTCRSVHPRLEWCGI